MSRKPKITSAERIERLQRIADILSMRLQGASLREIGDAYAISAQAVFKCVSKALAEIVSEAAEQARELELARLDELLAGGLYGQALAGDIASIDRVLAIMHRRARLMGLDQQTGSRMMIGLNGPFEEDGFDPKVIRVEVVGNPEAARREWLLQKRIAALGGDPNIDGESDTPPRH